MRTVLIPIKKQSKKAQKAFYAKKRRLWTRCPATRILPSGKLYRRTPGTAVRESWP